MEQTGEQTGADEPPGWAPLGAKEMWADEAWALDPDEVWDDQRFAPEGADMTRDIRLAKHRASHGRRMVRSASFSGNFESMRQAPRGGNESDQWSAVSQMTQPGGFRRGFVVDRQEQPPSSIEPFHCRADAVPEPLDEFKIGSSMMVSRTTSLPSMRFSHRSAHDLVPTIASPDQCAVCLETPECGVVSLRCGHGFCDPCLQKCAEAGLATCPVCRHPHELAPQLLRERLSTFRTNYRNWRQGGQVGAKGDLDDISAASSVALESTQSPPGISEHNASGCNHLKLAEGGIQQLLEDPADLQPVEHLTCLRDLGIDRESEYEARLVRVRDRMSADGFSTLVVACPANIHYLTGFDGWGYYMPQYLIVPESRSEFPVLIARQMDAAAGAFSTYLPLNRSFGYADHYVDSLERHPMQLAAQLIASQGWAAGTVAMDMGSDYMTARALREAEKVLGTPVLDDRRLVNWVRLIKSELELDKMRQAAKIMDKVLCKAVDTITPETRGCDLAAAIVHAQITGTAEYGGTFTAIPPILASGSDSDAGHMQWSSEPYMKLGEDGQAPQSKIGRGVAVAMELASSRDHYHCPMARTVMLGEPSEEYLRFVRCCYKAMGSMLSVAVAGSTCEALFQAYQDTLLAEGFSKSSRVGYSCGVGFAPDWGEKTISIRPGDKTVLEPNMCLHLIAGCGDGLIFETSEVVVIKPCGMSPELLHGAARKLFVKPLMMPAAYE